MSIFKALFGVILNTAIFGVLLLAPARTVDWWRAWVFLAVSLVASTASTLTLFRVNQELLAERFKPPVQAGQPLSDKFLVLSFIAAFFAWIVFI